MLMPHILMANFQYSPEQNFRFNLIKGQIGKELVRGLLEQSRYRVYPFGYESSISQLRYDVQRKRGVPYTDSNDRMRSMPDLMVYDSDKMQTTFVEVKFRKTDSATHVKLKKFELKRYQKYWSDSVLAVVVPVDHYFYAKKISEVRIFEDTESHPYDLSRDFEQMEKVFTNVSGENISRYRTILDRFKAVLRVEQDDETPLAS